EGDGAALVGGGGVHGDGAADVFGPVELGIDLGVEGVAVALQVARGGEVGVNREGLALGAAASGDEQGDEEEGEDGAKGVHGDEWRGLGPALSGATPEGEGGAGGEVDGQDRTGQGGGGEGAGAEAGRGRGRGGGGGAKGVHGDEWRGLGPALSGATPEGEGGAGGEVDGQDRTGQGGGGKGAVVDHGHGVVKAGLGHGGEVAGPAPVGGDEGAH